MLFMKTESPFQSSTYSEIKSTEQAWLREDLTLRGDGCQSNTEVFSNSFRYTTVALEDYQIEQLI